MTVPVTLTDALYESGIPCAENAPLSAYTSFRIGGPARLCILPQSKKQLIDALRLCRTEADGCPLAVLGKGSNVLCADSGFDGIVVVTGGAKAITFSKPDALSAHAAVSADAGASLTLLSRACVQHGRALAGLAFACGIPGSVGGAVVMNAGAYGGEMRQVVTESRYFDLKTGQIGHLCGDEHAFSYRHSAYSDHPEWVVLDVTLTLPVGDAEAIRAEMADHLTARREKQPLNYPSAGSAFKRPDTPGVYVGKMVEDCGLKGYTVGGAQVSRKHGGFIINTGSATAQDVRAVIRHVQAVIADTYGHRLACEIRMIGSDPES